MPLTRSATVNKITDSVEGLHSIADISSSYHNLRQSSTTASISHKIESHHITAGPSCSAKVDCSPDDSGNFSEPSSPTRLPLLQHSISSHTLSNRRSIPKKALKTPYLIAAASKTPRDRDTRIREIKLRALNIRSTGNTPATEQQRLVMLMVFKEITPYPDDAWLSMLAVLINREYHQVKNWFSNQRQKDARANRENGQYSLASALCKITCDGRVLRLRSSALECCMAEDWSDQFFEEVVMIHNVKILLRLRRWEAELLGRD